MSQRRVTIGVKAVVLNTEEWTLELHFVCGVLRVDFFVVLAPVF